MNKRIILVILCAVAGGILTLRYRSNKTTLVTEVTQNKKEENIISQPKKPEETKTMQKTDSGIQYEILTEAPADAKKPQTGQVVTAHYTGWLNDGGQPGAKFDSSVDRGQPFQFVVGVGQVIAGWDETMLDMKVGEKRRVIIPHQLGYGERGAGAVIPPYSDLMFDIEVLNAE